MKYLPNVISILRIALIPIILSFYYYNDAIIGANVSSLLFAIAALSDALDGYIARKFNAISVFGEIIDPIADKVIVASVLIVLVDKHIINVAFPIIILSREFIISGMRTYFGNIDALKVSILSKLKTALQMVGLFFLLFASNLEERYLIQNIGTIILAVATVLTVTTSINYIYNVLRLRSIFN